MEIAEIKSILSSGWHIERRLLDERLTIERLRCAASKATPSYSQVPGGAGDGQKIENYVLRIVELEEKCKRNIQQLIETQLQINCMIEALPETRLKLLMQKRYLDYKKWEEIAVEMSCSYRRVHQLHSKALNILSKKL